MNFTIIQSDTEKLFGALYENHDRYLDLSDIRISSPTNFRHSPIKRNISLSVNKTARSVNDHVKYLLYIQAEYEKANNAATKIQKYWRRYKFRAVYFRLKALLKKCTKIEPSLALRTVNPREASLLDAPSGAIVRFKLTGTEFPPKIVYKICSYRPVARVDTLLPNTPKIISQKVLDNIMHKEYKNKYNDWRIYDEKDMFSISKKDYRKYTKKNRPNSTKMTKHSNVMTWMKNQYGI